MVQGINRSWNKIVRDQNINWSQTTALLAWCAWNSPRPNGYQRMGKETNRSWRSRKILILADLRSLSYRPGVPTSVISVLITGSAIYKSNQKGKLFDIIHDCKTKLEFIHLFHDPFFHCCSSGCKHLAWQEIGIARDCHCSANVCLQWSCGGEHTYILHAWIFSLILFHSSSPRSRTSRSQIYKAQPQAGTIIPRI